MRLQKYLAMNGVGSRRKCEQLISAGKIKVNNKVITQMGTVIDPEKDRVLYDDKPVELKEEFTYIMLNKPLGYISSVKDNFDRKTVLDLVPVKTRIYPIGRLDYDSQGLIILTNDGELTYHLTHPRHHIYKIYEVKIKGKPTENELEQFRNGLIIDDYKTKKAEIRIKKEYRNNTLVEIQIQEGRNRQIRRMCEKINHPVIKLKRTGIGSLKLANLPTGDWRYLTEQEISLLKGY